MSILDLKKEFKKMRRRSLIYAFSQLCILLILTGCITTTLEFDRMTGTAFPQPQTVGGDTVTLQSIYADAGKLVVVEEDDTNIAPINDGTGSQKQCITNSELDSLMTTNRGSQIGPASSPCGCLTFTSTCTKYHVYGVVVDHYAAYNSGACKTGTIGRMWRTSDRSGFAIFYKHSTVSGDAKKYLRSTAHELGHTFNLHHEDGDGSKSIMTQTGDVGDTYEFKFSDESKAHLKDHPDECVYPGTGSFYSVCPDHKKHSYVTQDCGI